MTGREKVENILRRVAESEGISNFEVVLDEDVLKGDGFLSEFHTGDVRNKDTGERIQVYVKVPPQYDVDIQSDVYFNEYSFYSKIFPALDKFQKEKQVKVPFDKIPKFYCGSAASTDNEYVALENLKVQNYVLLDKTQFIDEDHLKYVFETYGKYHALTFAFKDQNREKHEELAKPLRDIFQKILNNEELQESLKTILRIGYEHIKGFDEEKAAKIKPLLDDIKGTTSRGLVYDGKYSALVHRDCWSNNLMFKYDDSGKLENVKLLDHQLPRNSTPVHDLSYFFYAGAGKKDFDKLDDYLDIYYKSFSSFAQELGIDPEKLLTLEALKADWKKYCFLGINMAFVVWPVKLVAKESIQEFTGKNDAREAFIEVMKKVYASDYFKKVISDILLHAVERNIIE